MLPVLSASFFIDSFFQLPCIVKKKVKCTLVQALGSVQAVRPTEGVQVWLYSFLTTALEGGEGSASRPGRSLLPGKTRYPLYRRLGGPQGRFGQVRKISPPPGFDPRTVQPVTSRYTDYATRLTSVCSTSDYNPTGSTNECNELLDTQLVTVMYSLFLSASHWHIIFCWT